MKFIPLSKYLVYRRYLYLVNQKDETIISAERKLRKIAGVIKQNGRKILKDYPITSTQFVALQWLIEKDDLTIGELSNKLGLAFSTTTDLVDRMDKNKLIKRVRDSKDRRVVRVHVLDKGLDIINEVINKRQDYLDTVLTGFTKEQKAYLNELLYLLHEQMVKVSERTN